MARATTKKKAVKKGALAKNDSGDAIIYRCTCCGKEREDPRKNFYKVTYSKSHKGNNAYSHICVDCVKELFEYYRDKYSQQEAVKIMCAMLDVPFYRSLYESVAKQHDDFSFGLYIRQTNGTQYMNKTFALTMHQGELEVTKKEAEEEAEELSEKNWTTEERRAKNEVKYLMGYDPFAGYAPSVRRKLFTELLGYLDDDDVLSDNYKISQIIQVINNNEQINQYDIAISRFDPKRDIDDIKDLSGLKRELVMANEKIVKENGISVKSRGDQKAGKGSLTGLMRDMRDKDIKESEVNFYNQLQSEASRWAVNVSLQSMLDNIQLGENDINDIIEDQRSMLLRLQDENDNLKEERRLLKVAEIDMKKKIAKYEERLGLDVIDEVSTEINEEMQSASERENIEDNQGGEVDSGQT